MIPIKKGITGTDIPNIAVETSDSTIPRKPILVEGGPAPEPITIIPLTVTENGTYTASENAAYSPVIVNVDKSKPDEIELVDFDCFNLFCTSSNPVSFIAMFTSSLLLFLSTNFNSAI